MNNEEAYGNQLNEDRAQTKGKQEGTGVKPKLSGTLVTLLKRFLPFLVPAFAETVSGGILPGNLGFVVWTYFDEKKADKSPNIAEFLLMGLIAGGVDAIGLLGLTGVLLILSYAAQAPGLILLFFWRIYKHGFNGPEPSKMKSKKS